MLYGDTLSAYVDVLDITSKDIGIEIQNGKMCPIIPKGTVLPVINKTLSFTREFILGGKNPKSQTIKVYEGSQASDNAYLSRQKG